MNAHDEPTKLLRIYLQDHIAVATAGARRASRLAHAEAHATDGAELATLADDLAADRDSLLSMVTRLGFVPSRVKTGLASVGEQLGLLKLNGRVVSRSPLSTIVELEALQMVVREKRSLWETLQQLPSAALSTDLDALIARADDQLAQLTDLHRARVSTTFIPSVAPTRP